MKKKNSINFSYIVILCVIILGCCTNNNGTRVEVLGFSIGDTINEKFMITKVNDFPFSYAQLKNDGRLEVSLINNHISSFSYNNLNKDEHNYFKELITETLNKTPKYFLNQSPSGVIIKGEVLFWEDTLSGVSVTLSWSDTIQSFLHIYNQRITDSLINECLPNADTNKLELMIFEEE